MHCKRILFIVDTPEGVSRTLAGKIAGLARCLAAEVEVFDVVFDPLVADDQRVQEAIERRQAELDSIVDLLREASVHARTSVSWAYPPREGIFRQIRRHQPDVVIIRPRQHGRLARMLFTYSDYQLIESAPCAVLVMKNDHAYTRVVAAVDPALTHDKPAALDERIVLTGATIAGALNLPLHLFHARSPWQSGEAFSERMCDLPAGVVADIAGASQSTAESQMLQLAGLAGVPAARVHIETGNPIPLLPAFVRKGAGDLLVMGAVSRSRIRKVLIGHTAEKVLEETDCDAMIVRPPEPAAVVR